jgi:retron-type reverse transcriptase
MGEPLRSPTVYTKLQQLAKQAVQHPDRVFTTVAYLVDVDMLREAFYRTADKAPGVDKVTKKAYARDLEANLANLHERLRTGEYFAPPVERVWLEEDGKKRPIGKPTLEDKVAQRAYAMVLSAIYEKDFLSCSYGYRLGLKSSSRARRTQSAGDEEERALGGGRGYQGVLRQYPAWSTP